MTLRRFVFLAVLAVAGLSGPPAAQATDYLFATSWQPGFCADKTDKPECAPATISGSYGASKPTLHGLWPQPNGTFYCNLPQDIVNADHSNNWRNLPAVPYQDPTFPQKLAAYMPGILSDLDRHEWFKHGTCSGMTPDQYFGLAIKLVTDMGRTQTARLIASRIGGTVTASELCGTLAQDFGSGIVSAAKLETIKIGRRTTLTGLWISLTDSGDGLTLDASHLTKDAATLSCSNVAPIDVPAAPH